MSHIRCRSKLEPRDGGQSWTVVLACAFTFFITGGIARSFTLVYQNFAVVFPNSSSLQMAMVASSFGAVKLCSSPLVSMLCNKFTCRKVAVVGALLSITGTWLSSLSMSLCHVYVTYGVISALGINMMITPSFIIIGQNFQKKKGKAMSLMTIGACLGGMFYPPIVNQLLENFEYQRTMLYLAISMLGYVVASVFYVRYTKLVVSVLHADNPVTPEGKEIMVQRTNSDYTQEKLVISIPIDNEAPIKRIDPFGVVLFKNVDFVLYLTLMTSSFLSMSVSNTFLAPIARENGINPIKVAAILSISSAINIPSRLLTGILFDAKKLSKCRPFLLGVIALFSGIWAIAIPMATGTISLAVFCIIHCFFGSSLHSQHITIISDLMESKLVPKAIGLCRLFQGFGLIIGPIIGGILSDHLQSHKMIFIISGSVFSFNSLLFILFFSRKLCNKKTTKSSDSASV